MCWTDDDYDDDDDNYGIKMKIWKWYQGVILNNC